MAKNEKPLVLVADDEPSTLALVANHLRSRGYRVIEATDGDEAWNSACRELPDVVVLDVMMPGMSGWEVCRKIREAVSLAHTGVVMLTGIGDTLNELTSPLYGADAYLDKPFQFAKLAELVESTLAQRTGGKLGRPKKTSGPGTRLYKTALDEDDDEPRSESRPRTEKKTKKKSGKKIVKKAAKKAAKKARKVAKNVATAVKAVAKKASTKKASATKKPSAKKATKKATTKNKASKKTATKNKATKKAATKKPSAKKATRSATKVSAKKKKATKKAATKNKAAAKKSPPKKKAKKK